MTTHIYLVDYGCGNIRSLVNALNACDADVTLVANPDDLVKADKIVLPGVGAFGQAMEQLRSRGFLEALQILKDKGTPIMGICLGMQLMCQSSDEGGANEGLGWIDAEVLHLKKLIDYDNREASGLKYPHMGWNEIRFAKEHPLLEGVKCGADVYFVHSHAVRCASSTDVLCTTEYGASFVSAFQRDQIFGMQFHPEKSHRVGLRLLQNFVDL